MVTFSFLFQSSFSLSLSYSVSWKVTKSIVRKDGLVEKDGSISYISFRNDNFGSCRKERGRRGTGLSRPSTGSRLFGGRPGVVAVHGIDLSDGCLDIDVTRGEGPGRRVARRLPTPLAREISFLPTSTMLLRLAILPSTRKERDIYVYILACKTVKILLPLFLSYSLLLYTLNTLSNTVHSMFVFSTGVATRSLVNRRTLIEAN